MVAATPSPAQQRSSASPPAASGASSHAPPPTAPSALLLAPAREVDWPQYSEAVNRLASERCAACSVVYPDVQTPPHNGECPTLAGRCFVCLSADHRLSVCTNKWARPTPNDHRCMGCGLPAWVDGRKHNGTSYELPRLVLALCAVPCNDCMRALPSARDPVEDPACTRTASELII